MYSFIGNGVGLVKNEFDLEWLNKTMNIYNVLWNYIEKM